MSVAARLKVLEKRAVTRQRVVVCCVNGEYWQPRHYEFPGDLLHGFSPTGDPCPPAGSKRLTLAQFEQACKVYNVWVIDWFAYTGKGRFDDLAAIPL